MAIRYKQFTTKLLSVKKNSMPQQGKQGSNVTLEVAATTKNLDFHPINQNSLS